MFAGPGAGKSTIAAHAYAKLKWRGVDVELVTEYAKDLVWEGRSQALDNQIYVFGKQLQRLNILVGQVDVIVTDSPLLLSCIYKTENLSQSFDSVVLDVFNDFNNINYFIERRNPYNPKGRLQTAEEAKIKNNEIKTFLESNNIQFDNILGNIDGVDAIVSDVMQMLKKI